jgi:hypothetical protein
MGIEGCYRKALPQKRQEAKFCLLRSVFPDPIKGPQASAKDTGRDRYTNNDIFHQNSHSKTGFLNS